MGRISKGGRLHAAIEGLRGERMRHRDQRDVRLLAKRKAKAKCAMCRQVAGENIGNPLRRIAVILLLHMITALLVCIRNDFTVRIDAHAVDEGFAVLAVVRFLFRFLVLGPDEAALDAGRAFIVERNECAAAADCLQIVGML